MLKGIGTVSYESLIPLILFQTFYKLVYTQLNLNLDETDFGNWNLNLIQFRVAIHGS